MVKITLGARLSSDTVGGSMHFFSENFLDFHAMILLLLRSVLRLEIDGSNSYCCVSSSSK